MNNKVRMRVGNGCKYLQKKPDSLLDCQIMCIAVLVYRSAFNELKDKVGLVASSDASVEQTRNVRMRELRKVAGFERKTLWCRGACRCR